MTSEPCQGFNDGSILLKFYNPLNENISISLDDIVIFDEDNPNADNTYLEFPFGGLASGDKRLSFTIGSCSHTENFFLNALPLQEEFKELDGDI